LKAETGRSSSPSRRGPKSRILIVADDEAVAKRVKTLLERAGYGVAVVDTVAGMRAALDTGPIDAVILDVGLADEDGWRALRWIRARGAIRVMMLTAKDAPRDKMVGLELGADGYLAKPVDPRALLARLRSLLRRPARAPAVPATGEPAPDAPIRFPGWVLDPVRQELRSETGERVHLTQAEYRILVVLARHPRQTITRDQLMAAAAGRDWAPFDRSIDVHISNLRRKLDPDASEPSVIRSVRGAGYMLVPRRRWRAQPP
jgi:two-component system OmpR family response regulator